MKLSALALSPLLVTAVCPLVAQKSSTAVHHRTPSTASSATQPCATLPALSPKIPALPAGSPCAKPLFTIATVPNIKFDYLSPIASQPALAETLGMESNKITLNYIDSKIGTGTPVSAHKFLTINYSGYLVDGTKFDSSYDRKEPFTISYGGHSVVLGWDTGFEGMRAGGKRRLFIPWQLGYGPNPQKGIPGKSMMIFDLELLAVSETDPTPPRPLPPPRVPSSTLLPPPAAQPPAAQPSAPKSPTTPQPPATPQTPATPQIPAVPQPPAVPKPPAVPQSPAVPQPPAVPQAPPVPQAPAVPTPPTTPKP